MAEWGISVSACVVGVDRVWRARKEASMSVEGSIDNGPYTIMHEKWAPHHEWTATHAVANGLILSRARLTSMRCNNNAFVDATGEEAHG